jgi:sulfate transport system substrate-binding protein
VLIHEDPRSSGVAEWAVLAEYGTAYLESGDQAVAKAQLQAIWRNVRLLSPSARSAVSLFELGAGDAYITYEQDARLTLARGVPLEIVLPSHTIVSRPVAIAVDENISQSEMDMVQAFMAFMVSEGGQRIFNQYHLRPVDLDSQVYPPISHPFTEEHLGGWSSAYSELVEKVWQAEIEPNLELETLPVELNLGN